MSSALDTRATVLSIINSVLRKLGTSPVSSVDANNYSVLMLQLLNETIADVEDYGNWEERYGRADATPVVGESLYTFQTADPIKRIHQVYYKDNRGAMKQIKKSEMNYLMLQNQTGTPNAWCVWGVDTQNNPQVRVNPSPSTVQSGDTFILFYYSKTPNLTVNDGDYLPDFPANLLIKGLYYKALLEQNDGELTSPIRTAMEDFINTRRETHNRFTMDSGPSVRFQPSGRYLGRR